ncbi:MAG TPA: EH signature domain-containing protein, partial [Hyphomicrobium sp.]
MTSLFRLHAALQQARSGSLHGLAFDTKAIDAEVTRLQSWIGERSSNKPAPDVTVAAMHAFHRDQELLNLRQARLVCFGCIDPILPDRKRLIEDERRFPKLLSGLDAYQADPRAFRRCYRGLLYGYFGYDAEHAPFSGKRNWEQLRAYLRERVTNTVASGWSPEWVDALQANAHLLSDNPGEAYGLTLLVGGDEEFDLMRKALDVHDSSWLVWRAVLGQIEAATRESDDAFRAYLPRLLGLLARHPLAVNGGMKQLLSRYRACKPLMVHPGLRDFAVERWGNPWLSLNKAKW